MGPASRGAVRASEEAGPGVPPSGGRKAPTAASPTPPATQPITRPSAARLDMGLARFGGSASADVRSLLSVGRVALAACAVLALCPALVACAALALSAACRAL